MDFPPHIESLLTSHQPLQPPIAPKPRPHESAQVTHYRRLRERIHEGPLYTVLGDAARVGKNRPPAGALFDPFEGMQTYTRKYKKQRNKIPRLDTRPYVLKFFPKELWGVIDPAHKDGGKTGEGTEGAEAAAARSKKWFQQIARSSTVSRLDRLEQMEDGQEDRREDDGDEDKEEELGEEVEMDDDFEEEEDDDNDDYNAEKYFEDLERDDFDEGGEGGGEDYE